MIDDYIKKHIRKRLRCYTTEYLNFLAGAISAEIVERVKAEVGEGNQ